MGCGGSVKADRMVTPDQATEITMRLQKQAEQILDLEKAQMQLVKQVSVLQRTVHSNNGCLRVGSIGGASPRCSIMDSRSIVALERPSMVALDDKESAAPEKQEKGALSLIPALQNYLWGQPWDKSLIARLCESSPDIKLNHGLNYAEMWMGTHPNGPSQVRLEGLDGVGHSKARLKETIARRPQYWLGSDLQRGDLPFMLKVISVKMPTSIQAHPDKPRAQLLHHSSPDVYADGNHKHELCLPLGEYEGLVGFRPMEEIRKHVFTVRELNLVIGDKLDGDLKEIFAQLFRSDEDAVRHNLASLVRRLERTSPEDLTEEEGLILRLSRDYPGDVGIFCVYFLNYVRVTGDTRRRYIFCPANEPHCHIVGDCVVCTSLSDNTVHAGLTKLHKDLDTFLDMLSYKDGTLSSLAGTGEMMSKRVVKYNTPVDDFMVYEVEGGNSGTSQNDPAVDLPQASVCICVKGTFSASFSVNGPVEEIRAGQCFLLKAGSCLTVLRSEAGSRLFVATY